MLTGKFREAAADQGSGDPTPSPAPTPAPAPEASPAPTPQYATKEELAEIKAQNQAMVRAVEGLGAEMKGMSENVSKQLAATRTVNAPQPPVPPQAIDPDLASQTAPKKRLTFREPYGHG